MNGAITTDVLIDPRLKVQRAYRHIDELKALSDPLSREFYSIQVEGHIVPPYLKPTRFSAVYRPRKPIAKSFALIMGDAIHNFRGALDHLCTGIVRAGSGKPNAMPYFPMRKKREDLESCSDLTRIEKALPGSSELLLEQIRPKDGPDEPLWCFNRLSNDDKHSSIIPTVVITNISNINARAEPAIFIENDFASGDADRPHHVTPIVGHPITALTIDQNFAASVEIRFPKNGPFGDESVIPTLAKIGQLVTKTLDAFERFIASR